MFLKQLCFLSFSIFSCILYVRVEADFRIVILPDTQNASQNFPEVFISQTEWISDNKQDKNILFVLHEGDIVNRGNNPNHFYQWDNANEALSVLDGIVPYSIAVGNHDMGPNGEAENRDTSTYNLYFPFERYENDFSYGGHMDDDNDNHFWVFRADGMDFLVLSLEFGPNSEMIEWGNSVLSDYHDHRIIILTHCYMNHDDTRVGLGDPFNPHNYGINDIDDPHDGEELWEALVKYHENVFLVLSGHILGDGTGRLTSIGINGNEVHQLLANYQTEENGGNGWLRVMTFSPAEDIIYVETYSPWLDDFKTDNENEFELQYEMTIFGDWNGDDIVDLLDYEMFQLCFTGIVNKDDLGTCSVFDVDGDNDIDLIDFKSLQEGFSISEN